jgi:hypothetical protein
VFAVREALFLTPAREYADTADDVALIFCLFLLATRSTDAALQRPLRLLASGLLIIVTADSIFDYQTLHGTYATGELIDVGWPLGDMLIGLAAYGVRCVLARAPAQRRPEDISSHVASARTSPLWQAMLPYALVPAVGALALVTWHTRGDAALKAGVYWEERCSSHWCYSVRCWPS